jgi:hypothetical protein
MYGCKEPGSNGPVRGMKPLWLDVQNALNDTLRRLFIEGFEKYIKITTDDDKMHFQLCSKADTQGLKSTQHVRDNHRGFVAHMACYTASGLPIGIEWERENDDSTAAATERLIPAQLAPTSGQMGPLSLPSLQWIEDIACHHCCMIFSYPWELISWALSSDLPCSPLLMTEN